MLKKSIISYLAFGLIVVTLGFTGLVVGTIGTAGCGGGGYGGLEADEETYNGPVSEITFSAGGTTESEYIDEDGDPLDMSLTTRDASSVAVGSGAGQQLDVIDDTASSLCLFSVSDFSNDFDSHIRIVSGTTINPPEFAACANQNKCILCTVDPKPTQNCSISCVGTIPSNAESDADSFDVTITIIHDFTTTMSAAEGLLRFDGDVQKWPEMDPLKGAVPLAYNIDGCDGGTNMTISDTDQVMIDASPLIAETTLFDWQKGYNITSLAGGPDCQVVQTMTARMYFYDASSGQDIDLARGTVTARGKICDTHDYCPE